MQTSSRISGINPSPTLALNAKAKRLQAQGLKVLNFAVGEPDYPCPQQVIEKAIAAMRAGKYRYSQPGGQESLRQAICQKLEQENHLAFHPHEIVCGMGAKEILFHAFLSLLNEGDEVLLTAPFWVSYQDQIRAAGGVPVSIPMSQEGKPLFVPEEIETFASPKTVAYVLCSPNNPAGYVLSEEVLARLGAYLLTKPWWLICDEIYEHLTFESPHLSLLQVCPALRDRLILVNGLSKSFAMTGWRVGYAAGPQSVIKLITGLQSHSSTCLPPFIEEAASWVVGEGRAVMAPHLATLRRRRDLAVAEIAKIPRLSYLPPQGAFYLFVDVRKALSSSPRFAGDNTMAFCDYLLEEKHLAVVPGEAFGTPGFIRLSYATAEATISAGIARLGEALAEL